MNYPEAIEQMERLDARLGKGQGASRERAKLQAVIDEVDGKVTDHKAQRLAKKHNRRKS